MNSLKIVLPATLLPLGAQAGIAPFRFLTTTTAQAADGVEPVQFVLRKGKWWEHRDDDGGSNANSNSNANSSGNSSSNGSSNSSDDSDHGGRDGDDD